METYRLSPLQLRLWRSQSDPGSLLAQARVELTGPFEPQRFSARVEALAARYDALRLRFGAGGAGEVLQSVAASAAIEWRCVDLRGHPAAERAQLARAWLDEASGRRFDLAAGPALRAAVATVED